MSNDEKSEPQAISSETEILNELGSLIDALVSIAPTRNKISQFVLLVKGMSYNDAMKLFPFLKDRRTREEIFNALGLQISPTGTIEFTGQSFASGLSSILTGEMMILSNINIRNALSAALLRRVENLKEEWVYHRLQRVSREAQLSAHGKAAITILKFIRSLGEKGGYIIEKSKLINYLKEQKIDEKTMKDAINLLINYKLIEVTQDSITLADDVWHHLPLIDEI